jgi:hypothetical protein
MDAVADSIAGTLGKAKSEVFDVEGGGSMGVQMAIGETHIIAEWKIEFVS